VREGEQGEREGGGGKEEEKAGLLGDTRGLLLVLVQLGRGHPVPLVHPAEHCGGEGARQESGQDTMMMAAMPAPPPSSPSSVIPSPLIASQEHRREALSACDAVRALHASDVLPKQSLCCMRFPQPPSP